MYDALVKEQTIVNGIDVDAFNATLEAVAAQPELADLQFRAANKWVGGTRNETTVNEVFGAGEEHSREKPFTMIKDEPVFLLGTDDGPNPVEHLLAALAGCLTTTLVYFAAADGIRLDEVTSKIEADASVLGFLGIDPGIRAGCAEIRVTFDIKSPAPRETVEALVALVRSRSGVFDTLTNPTPVTVRLA